MKTAKYILACGGLLIVLFLLGMEFALDPEMQGFGPEVDGLRMGLDITNQYTDNINTYHVRIRIRNTSDQPTTLVGYAPYEGKINNYAEWLQAEVSFSTYPEIIPPSAQTCGAFRTSPNPQTTIDPGKEFTASWSSQGRYLKPDDYYNTTPCFTSDGLFGIRAHIHLLTDGKKEIVLYSNDQAVSVGGSVALPKYGVATVIQRDEKKNEVLLSLGSRHRISKGDQFHIMDRFPYGWMMTVTEVDPTTCRASIRISGDPKKMEPLPPLHARAQLWDFGQ